QHLHDHARRHPPHPRRRRGHQPHPHAALRPDPHQLAPRTALPGEATQHRAALAGDPGGPRPGAAVYTIPATGHMASPTGLRGRPLRWRQGGFCVSDARPDPVRAALAARLDGCWDRLDDVVSELHAVHEVAPESIVARVLDVITEERAERGRGDY